jgi:hypothetical protein
MDFGKVEYRAGHMEGDLSIRLTLVGQGDSDALRLQGLAGLRRKRILRLALEALEQGCTLGYSDLSSLLMTSVSTLKRDVAEIERAGGRAVPLRRRRSSESTAMRGVSLRPAQARRNA